MNAFARPLPVPNAISAILMGMLMAACTHRDMSQAAKTDIGSKVLLEDFALACEHPSEELNKIAKSNGKDMRYLEEKVSRQKGCYEASSFEKGQWKVLARNDMQVLIKMQGYSGEYWVSIMHIRPGELPAIRNGENLLQSNF